MGIATRTPEYVTFGTAEFSDATVQIGIAARSLEIAPRESLRLEGSIASGWRLIQPLRATVEWDEDGSCIVSDDLFVVYGAGESLAAARTDYIDSLVEYYRLLAGHDDPPTQALFRYLRTFLVPEQ